MRFLVRMERLGCRRSEIRSQNPRPTGLPRNCQPSNADEGRSGSHAEATYATLNPQCSSLSYGACFSVRDTPYAPWIQQWILIGGSHTRHGEYSFARCQQMHRRKWTGYLYRQNLPCGHALGDIDTAAQFNTPEQFNTPAGSEDPLCRPGAAVRTIDANSATEVDLSTVVSPTTAGQILSERNKGRFANWPDLIHRVVGLSAAQTAFLASLRGLTVGGQSLPGASPNPALAEQFEARLRGNR